MRITRKESISMGLVVFAAVVFIILLTPHTQPIYWEIKLVGTSMEPTIPDGSTILIEVNYAITSYVAGDHSLRTGDVALFNATLFPIYTCYIIHRIIKIIQVQEHYWFQTQGDNNAYIDPFEWAEYSEHYGFSFSTPAWWGTGWVLDDLIIGRFIKVLD